MPSSNSYKVLLPEWVLKKRELYSFEQFLEEVRTYMQRYPHYIVDSVEGSFAVCVRLDSKNQRERSQGML